MNLQTPELNVSEATIREGVEPDQFLEAYGNYQKAARQVGAAREIKKYETGMEVTVSDLTHAVETRLERRRALRRVIDLVEMPEVHGPRRRKHIAGILSNLAVETESELELQG